MKTGQIRELFPQLSEKVYGKGLVYFDNAATSLRPESVVKRVSELSLKHNANIHRAVHKMSNDATEAYEEAREAVREYLNAENTSEIVFTSGTTESINLVARSFGEMTVGEGDEIIISACEHHSDIVPWQMLCKRKGARIKVLPFDENGRLKIEELEGLITPKTKLFCVAHISNVLGLVNPVKEMVQICHSKGCPVLVDGAQGIVHCKVDVRDIDCDFYVFSGHKLYAATGTGVLYGKQRWMDAIPPVAGGGDMIESVSWERTTYAKSPLKFEAGTRNFNAVPSFIQAIETDRLLKGVEAENELSAVKEYLYGEMVSLPAVKLYGKTDDMSLKAPIFSITADGSHHEDIALILDKLGIAVRSGKMCAEPLMDSFGVSGMLRASLAPYNTMEEAEYFVECLKKAIKMLV